MIWSSVDIPPLPPTCDALDVYYVANPASVVSDTYYRRRLGFGNDCMRCGPCGGTDCSSLLCCGSSISIPAVDGSHGMPPRSFRTIHALTLTMMSSVCTRSCCCSWYLQSCRRPAECSLQWELDFHRWVHGTGTWVSVVGVQFAASRVKLWWDSLNASPPPLSGGKNLGTPSAGDPPLGCNSWTLPARPSWVSRTAANDAANGCCC